MPAIRGLAKARLRVRPRQRRAESLSSELEERIFANAQVLSEGRESETDRIYYGSTLISADLARLGGDTHVGREDAEALARVIEGSVRVHVRAMRIARAEALRRASGASPGTAHVEIRVRVKDTVLELDVDVALALDAGVACG